MKTPALLPEVTSKLALAADQLMVIHKKEYGPIARVFGSVASRPHVMEKYERKPLVSTSSSLSSSQDATNDVSNMNKEEQSNSTSSQEEYASYDNPNTNRNTDSITERNSNVANTLYVLMHHVDPVSEESKRTWVKMSDIYPFHQSTPGITIYVITYKTATHFISRRLV
jgi:hypothetical protein